MNYVIQKAKKIKYDNLPSKKYSTVKAKSDKLGYNPEFPSLADDLDPFPKSSKPDKEPLYRGWTHGDHSDSWFLEDKVRSIHDDFMDFYQEKLSGSVIVPKLWTRVM